MRKRGNSPMINFNKVYDISITLGSEDTTYPGDVPFAQINEALLAKGDAWNLTSISMSSHAGTHIDVPYHYFNDNPSIEVIDPAEFIMPARIITAKATECVRPEVLNGVEIAPGSAVLFKTANSESGHVKSGRFSRNYVYIHEETAAMCVEKKLRLVGIDYLSVDSFSSPNFPVHQILLKSGMYILENINLKDVQDGTYSLVCLPLKINRAEATPVRAVLLQD